MKKTRNTLREKLRAAFADYKYSEARFCYSNIDRRQQAEEVIAKLLHVPMYKDKSGYDFYRYRNTTH